MGFKIIVCGMIFLAMGCSTASESPQVTFPVRINDGEIAPFDTALGYRVDLNEARLAVKNIVFTVSGELHTASLWDFFVPSAYAHPGHYEGGDVTGQLAGAWALDLNNTGHELGSATLLPGKYFGVNFGFSRGNASMGLAEGDPMIGHTAIFRGTARKLGIEYPFEVITDSEEDRILVGAPFGATLDGSSHGVIGLMYKPVDPYEKDTAFDDLDFSTFTPDDDGVIRIVPGKNSVEDAYNKFHRRFETHDHYSFSYNQAPMHVTAYGESFIENGIPASAVSDGWALSYKKFDVQLKDIHVAGATFAGPISVDLTKKSQGHGTLVGSASVNVGSYAGGEFTIDTITIEGTATKGNIQKQFAWTLNNATDYSNCHSTTLIDTKAAGTFQITVHADHLLFDSIVSSDPAVGFQAFADADRNNDGHITPAELLDTDIKTFDPGNAAINNLWDWLLALSATVGHINGEGHCHAAPHTHDL